MATLMDALDVGPVTLRNRIVQGCHQTQFGPIEGLPGESYRRYLEERARGEVGLIVAEGGAPLPNAQRNRAVFRAYGEGVSEVWRPIAKTVTEDCGVPLFAQILHGGRQGLPSLEMPEPLWSPSTGVCRAWGQNPKRIGKSEMQWLIEAHVKAAQNLVAGGVQGIELHSCHGYLLSSFLSPKTNDRKDEYGGSLENRTRLLRETLEAMRDALGSDVALGVRMESQEFIANGLVVDEAAKIARQLDSDGKVDYISVSQGTHEAQEYVRAPMQFPKKGYAVDITAQIKNAVTKTPVFSVGKIIDPSRAEQIIAEGKADAVVMTRELICDPNMAKKIRTGRSKAVRRCIACNHCVAEAAFARPIRCIQNPEIGREAFTRPKDGEGKSALVVGGGPGGLEAARNLALRGFSVLLREAAEDIGGQLRLPSRLESRRDFQMMIEWYRDELERLGVTIQANSPIRAGEEISADKCVVATGAIFADSDTQAFAEGKLDLKGKHIVVTDRFKDTIGFSLTELCAEAGADKVTLVTHYPTPGLLLDTATRVVWLRTLASRGVDILTMSGVSPDKKAIVGLGGKRTEVQIDYVFTADRVANKLNRRWPEGAIFLGDSEAPRSALDATNDAYLLCRSDERPWRKMSN